MGEMADYINIAVLGKVDTRNGVISFYDEPQPADVLQMRATCRQRNIPLPEIFDSEWGYKRVRCECGRDFAIRGYLRHFSRMHAEQIPKKIILEEIEETAAFDPAPAPFNEKSWRARAKASHDRIINRFA